MRALVLVMVAACYSPDLAPCAVHCDNTTPCPNDMTCAADKHSHAAGDTTICPNSAIVTVKKSGTGGGHVTSPAGIDCGTSCSVTVAPNATVALAAEANPGSRFTGWSGGCTGTDTCVLVATTDQTATAGFNLSEQLDVTFPGAGMGMVTSVPAGIACTTDCGVLFDAGITITLTATSTTSTFMTWTGPCTGTDPCVIVLDSMMTVGADFE
jgi:hypothetical protein